MSAALRPLSCALAATALLLGCAGETEFVQVRQTTGEAIAVSRIAVAPFRTVERPGAVPIPDDAGPLIGGYVASAFSARGLEVVPPPDVAQGLGLEIAPREVLDPREVAAAAHRKFGADAVAIGVVHRFVDRSGEALGSTRPASVGFEVRIVAAPAGNVVWTGAFEETQVALADNLLRAPQYPGGGTRWLSAEEFARWGAGKVVEQVPLAAVAP